MSLRKGVGIGVCLIAIVTVAGCGGGGSDPSDGVSSIEPRTTSTGGAAPDSTQVTSSAKHANGGGGNAAGYPYPDGANSPGKMLGAGAGFVSGGVMDPETSGWEVSSGSENTIVVAGGDARHPSDGLFSIIRTSYYVARQRINDVGVPGTGPVTITNAPLGRKIVVSAQKHGNIEFKSKSGISGTLHLSDDTVTLNP